MDSIEEPEDAFNEDGTYNATDWNINDVITAVKLNKIEEAISALTSSSGNIDTSNFATKDDIGNIDAILDNINGEVI